MNISRRTFGAVLAGTCTQAVLAQTNLKARVKIDTERQIGAIDPKVYGSFVEHIGRCVYGGLYEEASPLSDARGYRKDVFGAVKPLNLNILRYPGGNFASGYHWMDGIGPRQNRPARLEMAWGTAETNRFGTHEFLDYAEMLGVEPYLCANLGTGSWDEAQRWVEYTNISDGTEITRMRKRNGREQPWKVKYWGLGNEMDMPFQMGQRSADDYGKFALEAAKLMKWTDPEIKLIAAGASNFFPGADWIGWNRTVLGYLRNHIDYIALHTYVGNPTDDYYEFLSAAMEVAERTRITQGLIEAAYSDLPRGPAPLPGPAPKAPQISIAWDEWNVWYRTIPGTVPPVRDPNQRGRSILEERYNLEDALVVATIFNTFINHAHIVKMANMSQLVNVIAPIMTDEKGMFLQTIYHPLFLFANNSHGDALELFVDSPTYKTKKHDAVPYLDVSAALDSGTLVLNAVNRHKDEALEGEFVCQDKSFRGSWTATEVNGPDIKATNDFGVTRVGTDQKTVIVSGNTLRYRFPAHSYTMLKGEVG